MRTEKKTVPVRPLSMRETQEQFLPDGTPRPTLADLEQSQEEDEEHGHTN